MSKSRYFQVFKDSYTEEYPCIQKSSKSEKHAFCTICRSDFLISHAGRNDVYRHVSGPRHLDNVKLADGNNKVSSFFKTSESNDEVTRAELLFTSFLVEHNVPLNAASHAGPLFRKMFPKSDIAKKYGCGRTKSSHLVLQMAEEQTEKVVKILQQNAFSAACDGSNDTDHKLYPVVVTYFDEGNGKVMSTPLAIPDLEGNSTGENISSLILNVLKKHDIPFGNCIAFSADNANVMQGKKSGVISFLKRENEKIVFMGCCCHLLHLASEKAASTLPVKIEDVVIEIFYYLKKSANRKEALTKFQHLYGKEAQKILKHVHTRWLSLGRSLTRLVEQWEPLMSFFREESTSVKLPVNLTLFKIPKINNVEGSSKDVMPVSKEPSSINVSSKQGDCAKKRKNIEVSKNPPKKLKSASSNLTKEERIFMFLSSDVSKAYCLFLLSVIPSFEKVNIILQSSTPQIHILRSILMDLLRELYAKFMKPSEVKGNKLDEVNFSSLSNHKAHEDLIIGTGARNLISKCSEADQKDFYKAVIKYFVTACGYIVKKFPLRNDVLRHAEVVNLAKFDEASFSSVMYFVNLFPFLLRSKNTDPLSDLQEIDRLEKEFSELQLDDLSSLINSKKEIDILWGIIKERKSADGEYKYKRIANVMLSILLIPHSNAECERIFSIVRKNRTESRNLMSNKTLESLLILKCKDSQICYNQLFDDNLLKRAKKATAASLNSINSHAAAEEDK